MTAAPLLAHAGPGHTWQAMVVVAGVALMGVMIAAALGKLPMARPDDLVMPLAIIAIGTSLAPLASYWISDAIGVGLPLGVIALLTLLLAALTPLDIRLPAPLPLGSLTLAVIVTVFLFRPLTIALHPPADMLPPADDSEVTITAPADDATLSAGEVDVGVTVTGGTIGPGGADLADLSLDPEEGGALAVALQPLDDDGTPEGTQQRLEVTYDQECTLEDPCTEVTFPIEVDPGEQRLTVEFTRGDDTPFATPVRDTVEFSAE